MEGAHVELYVRSLSPSGLRDQQGTVIERLKRMAEEGEISGYTVHVCGAQVPATPAETRTEFGRFLLNRIAVFELWAERNDRSYDDWFLRRAVEGAGPTETELVFPAAVFAVYEADELRYVTPCETPEDLRAVHDSLDSLGTGGLTDTEPLPKARAQPAEQSTPVPQ